MTYTVSIAAQDPDAHALRMPLLLTQNDFLGLTDIYMVSFH